MTDDYDDEMFSSEEADIPDEYRLDADDSNAPSTLPQVGILSW